MQSLFSQDLHAWQTNNLSAGESPRPHPNLPDGSRARDGPRAGRNPHREAESDSSGGKPTLNLGAKGLLTNTFSITGMWWPQQHA